MPSISSGGLSRRLVLRRAGVLGLGGVALAALAGCAEPQVVEKEVVKIVTQEVPVEKIVTQIVEKQVPVEKIVEVEKIVTQIVEKLVTQAPAPAATAKVAGQAEVWRIGIFEDVTTYNLFNILGPGQTVWNFYAFLNRYPFVYGLSDQRYDWVPVVADGFPTDFAQEGEFVTTTVKLKDGPTWSDGQPITADDVAFTINTVLDLELTEGNWSSLVDANSIAKVEALDPKTVKYFFKEQPGLARWQFGISGVQFVAKHFWEPLVAKAKTSGATKEEQRKALFGVVPDNEPTAGEMVFVKWESGAFVQVKANDKYFFQGSKITQYKSGAFAEEKPAPNPYSFTAYGQPGGDKVLEITRKPAAPSVVYSIYPSQDAAVLALQNGEIDYMLTPLGLARGFQSQLAGSSDIRIVVNPPNGIRYMGFNTRTPPMELKEFRQAVSILIDKEFVTKTILQGVADPAYTMVPPGNGFWYNPDVPQLGIGLSREERVNQVVELLKGAGFTWGVEPKWDADLRAVAPKGEGLTMPNGKAVPALELLSPSAGYDPMRSTYAIWIEQWLNEVGIPLKANLTGFNVIVPKVFDEQKFDMWILGWGLTVFPDYLHGFFSSANADLGENNAGGFTNEEFDAQAELLIKETDINKARDIAFRLQEILADEVPYVVLFTTQILEPVRANVKFAFDQVMDGVQNYFQSMNGPLSSTSVE